jgi:DNA-binding NarL/FixJ family response regulator
MQGTQTVDGQDSARRFRVVIADADPLARRVVRDELQGRAEFVVVAEASDGVEAIELCRYYKPELLVSEAVLPRASAVEVARQLSVHAPDLRMVIFAVGGDPTLEMKALRAGACGYLSKDEGAPAVVEALLAAIDGEAAVSGAMTMALIERLRMLPEAGTGMRPVTSTLTSREWEVLDLLAAGSSTMDVADRLFLTADTVYSHVKHIMRKLGVRTRADAIAAARQLVDVSLSA